LFSPRERAFFCYRQHLVATPLFMMDMHLLIADFQTG
jgi:hypothetical protein